MTAGGKLLLLGLLSTISCVAQPGPAVGPLRVSAASASASASPHAATPLRPMSNLHGARVCGRPMTPLDGGPEIVREHPGECLLETGCDRSPVRPIDPCPEVAVRRVEDLVRQPSLQRAGEKITLRGSLAMANGLNFGFREGEVCHPRTYLLTLQQTIGGSCYAVDLEPSGPGGLSCPGDATLVCCGDLPIGKEVAVTGVVVGQPSPDVFEMMLGSPRLCTLSLGK